MFSEDVRSVVLALRSALADVLASSGGTGRRASDVARDLGIDTKLAWKVTKLVSLADVFEAAQYAPGKAGMELFLAGAEERGAAASALGSARTAFTELGELIARHGGDRRTFNILLAGQAEASHSRLAMEHRREAFSANSFLWGLQARAQLKTYLLHPAATEGRLDAAILAGFSDLRCLRGNTTWPVSRPYRVDDAGEVHRLEGEPLDPDAAAEWGDLPVLRAFTTVPSRGWRPADGRRAVVGYQRVHARVGRTGAVSFMTGEIVRGAVSGVRTPETDTCTVHTRLRTPCETVSFDVFCHRDLFDGAAPEPRLYRGLFQSELLSPLVEEDRMPLDERIESLGVGLTSVRSPALDTYPKLIHLACERAGWDPREFVGWRISMPFPPIPAILALHRSL